jgi:hypothetical protein
VAAASGTPSTASTPAASFSFVNGDFEDGTSGWQKYGGELRDVNSPRRGGSGAGAFISTTSSTKWVYQTVRIDPGTVYEFQGHVRPDAGVLESYLRISWYASADGSGRALATDDSAARVSGGSGAFVHLTTGGRTPPAQARSARLRVMLAPAGAGAAIVHLDDFAFGVAPTSAAPLPASTAVALDDPPEVAEAPPETTPAPESRPPVSATAAPAASSTAVSATGTAGTGIAPTAPSGEGHASPPQSEPPSDDDEGQPWEILLASAVVLVIAVGGSYLLAKRPPG